MILPTEEFTRTPEEITKDVLSRYTVLDLREQSDEDLAAAEERYLNADNYIRVLKTGTTNLIRWWRIESNGERYEVRRFENFVWCSCRGFFFSKTSCKHVYVTTKAYSALNAERMDKAPYIKQSDAPTVAVGKIRI